MVREYVLETPRQETERDSDIFLSHLLGATALAGQMSGKKGANVDVFELGLDTELYTRQQSAMLGELDHSMSMVCGIAEKYRHVLELLVPSEAVTGSNNATETSDKVSLYGEIDPTSIDLVNGTLKLNDPNGKVLTVSYGNVRPSDLSVTFPDRVYLDSEEAIDAAENLGQSLRAL